MSRQNQTCYIKIKTKLDMYVILYQDEENNCLAFSGPRQCFQVMLSYVQRQENYILFLQLEKNSEINVTFHRVKKKFEIIVFRQFEDKVQDLCMLLAEGKVQALCFAPSVSKSLKHAGDNDQRHARVGSS